MLRTQLLLALGALIVFAAPAIAQDTDAKANVKAICDHLAANAVDYDDEDKGACVEELGEVFTQVPAEKQAPFVACVTSKKPIQKDDFGVCFGEALGGAGLDGMPAPEVSPEVAAEVEKVCKHLAANAADFSEEDARECPSGLGMVAQLGGPESFKKFSGCVLAKPAPSEEDLEGCLTTSGLLDSLGAGAPTDAEPAPVKQPESK